MAEPLAAQGSPFAPPGTDAFWPKQLTPTATKDHHPILSTLLSKGEFPLIEKFKQELDAGMELVHRNNQKIEYFQYENTLKQRVYEEALASGDVDTAVGVVTAPQTKPTDWALERKGLDDLIIKGGDTIQDKMLNDPVYNNYLSNSAVLQSFIDQKKSQEIDTQSWGDALFDFVTGFAPVVQTYTDQKEFGFLSNIAKEKANKYSQMMNLPPEEFEKALPLFWEDAKASAGWFKSDEGKAFQELMRLNAWNDPSFLSMDNLPYIDLLGLGASAAQIGGRAAKSVLSSPSALLHSTGNRQQAAQQAVQSIVQNAPNAAHNVLPGVLQAAPTPNLNIATPTGYTLAPVNPAFATSANRVLNELNRLYKAEDAGAVEKILDATKTEYAKDRRFNDRIMDVQYDNQLDNADPNKSRTFDKKVNIYIGQPGGTPFATVHDAQQYIQNTKGLSNPIITTDINGDVVVRIQGNPYEAGSIQKMDLNNTSPFLGTLFGKVLGKKVLLPDTMFGKQLEANNFLEFARAEIQTFDKVVQKLGKGELEDLDRVMKKGLTSVNPATGKTTGVWYDPIELQAEYANMYGRRATPKEVNAYQALQAKYDLAWLVRNEVTYRELAFNNYKALKDGSGNSYLVKDVTDLRPTDSIVDWRPSRTVPLDQDPNVKILRFSQPHKFGNFKYKHVAVDKDQILDELPDTVVAYQPGGPRGYQGEHFLKQTNAWSDQQTGKTIVDNPNVLSVYVNKAEADEWAAGLNNAMSAFNKYQDGTLSFSALDNLITTTFNGKYTTQHFLQDIADQKLNPKYKVEVTKDNGVPTEQNALVSGPSTINFTSDTTPNADILAKQGDLYFSGRGSVLEKMGSTEAAEVISPLDMIHRGTDTAMRSGAYWNYRLNAAGSWFESLKAAGYPIQGPDALRHIMGPDIDVRASGVVNPALVKLRAIQQHFKEVMNPPDAMDTSIMQWAMGQISKREWEDAWIGKYTKKIGQTNIPQMARAAMFFKTFAFDLTQVPLQMITIAQSAAITGPTIAFKAGMQDLTYAGAAAFDRMGKLTDTVRNNMATATGLTRKEWDENYDFINRSGFLHIGGSHGYLDNDTVQRQVKTAFGRAVSWAGEKAVIPFTKVEQALRGNAMVSAIEEFRVANPGVSIMRADAREAIMKRADVLSISMHRVNNADMQKGLPGIFTQFMAFQQRSMEQIFSKKAGLTAAERFRVLGMHMAMHGSYGVPVIGAALTQIATDYDLDPEMIRSASGGLVDLFWSYVLDTPVDSSQRFAPFGSDIASSTVKGAYNWWYSKTAPEFSADDLAPSIDVLAKLYGGTSALVRYLQAGYIPPQNPDIDWALLKETAGQFFSATNRLIKAGLVIREQEIRNTKGQKIAFTDSPDQALGWGAAAFLGIQPQEVHDMLLQQNKERLSKAVYDAAADALFALDVKVQQSGGNQELIKQYIAQKENVMKTLSPGDAFKMYGTLQERYKRSVVPQVDAVRIQQGVKAAIQKKDTASSQPSATLVERTSPLKKDPN